MAVAEETWEEYSFGLAGDESGVEDRFGIALLASFCCCSSTTTAQALALSYDTGRKLEAAIKISGV